MVNNAAARTIRPGAVGRPVPHGYTAPTTNAGAAKIL